MTDPRPLADGLCEQCGHDGGAHMLMGYENPLLGMPSDGWIECPIEECECSMTWSLSDELYGGYKKYRAEKDTNEPMV